MIYNHTVDTRRRLKLTHITNSQICVNHNQSKQSWLIKIKWFSMMYLENITVSLLEDVFI